MQHNIAEQLLSTHSDFADAQQPVPIEGMSSARLCAFLNQLVRHMNDDECYLEVGTWKGRTLLSAAHGNLGRLCIGCDKFRLWGRFTGLGLTAKVALLRNIQRHARGSATIEFHHTTSERLFADKRVAGPVGVYFYDGDHSFHGTYHGLMAAEPILSQRAVVLMDDWNDPVIRGATFAGLRDAQLRILWERELAGDHTESTWWNGLGVFFVERNCAREGLPSPSASSNLARTSP